MTWTRGLSEACKGLSRRLTTEQVFTFAELARRLPSVGGKKIHVSSLHRWRPSTGSPSNSPRQGTGRCASKGRNRPSALHPKERGTSLGRSGYLLRPESKSKGSVNVNLIGRPVWPTRRIAPAVVGHRGHRGDRDLGLTGSRTNQGSTPSRWGWDHEVHGVSTRRRGLEEFIAGGPIGRPPGTRATSPFTVKGCGRPRPGTVAPPTSLPSPPGMSLGALRPAILKRP